MTTHKLIRIAGTITLLCLLTLLIWLNLPYNILYRTELKAGNEFKENIEAFRLRNGTIPAENQWKVLEILNPLKPYREFYPEYKQIDKDHFTLTYIEGFDGPYLTYDSRLKKWDKK